MEVKGKICLVLSLLVAVFLVSATVSLARSERDPEVGVCKLKCEEIRGAEQDETLRCKQSCEKYHQEKQRREREGGQGRERGHTGGRSGSGGGQYDIVFADIERELREMVGKCHQSCQGSKGEQENPECFRTCMEKYVPEQGKRRGGGGGDPSMRQPQKGRRSERGFGKGQQLNNPYVFEDHHFTARLESEQGSVRILQKFTDRSELFQGIGKYRVAILEAEPQTFVIPNHWDADALFFVVNGEGTISLINTDSRENHNIKRGDIFRVPAGISAYLINRHNNEKLVLAKIIHSISVPGELQTFISAGAGNPESSFFNAFSTEILEAAFNMDRQSLETLFGQKRQQEQGMFKKATEEQIRALSGKDESVTWPFVEKKNKGPYNIYKNKPSVQNEYGNLHEVDSNDFPYLQDMNVAFSLFNITQGSMAGPFYNTKTTTVLVVADGYGQFEMACPHLSEQSSRGVGDVPSYEKVSSQLRRGTVVVVPAGHPVVIEASGEQNLEVIGFGLNSDQNEWFPLAGRDNVMSQWEDEAMELTFGVPANQVQQVIQKQNKKLFFKGPERRGRAFA